MSRAMLSLFFSKEGKTSSAAGPRRPCGEFLHKPLDVSVPCSLIRRFADREIEGVDLVRRVSSR
jgi:hypothetical protein